jgi:hypothetical protein
MNTSETQMGDDGIHTQSAEHRLGGLRESAGTGRDGARRSADLPGASGAFDVLCVVAGLGWVLVICALGAGAALLGWRALDRWCERQLMDTPQNDE